MTSVSQHIQRGLGLLAAVSALSIAAQARQTIGCTTGGPGGPIPTAGTGGGGVYPTTLPPNALSLPLAVPSLPPGATSVTEIKFNSVTHTFSGDLQWVVFDPSGVGHNLFNRPGGGCDLGGTYVIVPECTGGTPFTTCTGTVTPGNYDQFFGTWPSGTNNIFNTPLSTIPVSTGTWTLVVYDWAGGDIGTITSWDICFGTPAAPSAPSVAPTLTAPADLSTASIPVTLTWNTVPCATSYDVDVDGSVTTAVSGNSFVVSPAPGSHTWSVRARNVTGVGPWATVFNFLVPLPPPASICVSGGPGGAIPTSGTGGTGSVWPGTFPLNEMVSSYSVTPPPGATKIVKVQLDSLSHTWIGDLQIVLTDPTGGRHNVVYRPGSVTGSVGLACDYGGTYSIYESSGLSFPTTCTALTPGDYVQTFGDWPTGTSSVFNTPLGLIPISSGTWTLTIYDWAGGDSGTLGGWQLCFDTPSGPTTFCPPQAPGSTNGCIATIAASGQPNAAHSNPCTITVSNVEGQKQGLIFYGISGQVNVPWCLGGASFLCVKLPTQRMPILTSGGVAGTCTGQLVQDWNAFQLANPGALGSPWVAGDVVNLQGWFRDPPACKTTQLTEGLQLTYQ